MTVKEWKELYILLAIAAFGAIWGLYVSWYHEVASREALRAARAETVAWQEVGAYAIKRLRAQDCSRIETGAVASWLTGVDDGGNDVLELFPPEKGGDRGFLTVLTPVPGAAGSKQAANFCVTYDRTNTTDAGKPFSGFITSIVYRGDKATDCR